MKFVLNKAKWLRGNNIAPETSQLLRKSDGLMCCIGQLAEQCGVPRSDLLGMGDGLHLAGQGKLPELLAWLITEPDDSDPHNSADASEAYRANDNITSTDDEKIALLRPIFARHGIELEVTEGT